jgi:hypothetical protein
MDALTLDPSKPYVYVTVSGLWPDADLMVFLLKAPPPGEANPTETLAATITTNGLQKDGIPIPTTKASDGTTSFACAGLRFSTVADTDQVGTVKIELRREEDKPALPPWDGWLAQVTCSLVRNGAGDAVYLAQDVAISKETSK